MRLAVLTLAALLLAAPAANGYPLTMRAAKHSAHVWAKGDGIDRPGRVTACRRQTPITITCRIEYHGVLSPLQPVDGPPFYEDTWSQIRVGLREGCVGVISAFWDVRPGRTDGPGSRCRESSR